LEFFSAAGHLYLHKMKIRGESAHVPENEFLARAAEELGNVETFDFGQDGGYLVLKSQ